MYKLSHTLYIYTITIFTGAICFAIILYNQYKNNRLHMQKYKVILKLKKTKHCTYYTAEDITTKRIVTIKKISHNDNLDEIVNGKQIQLMKEKKYDCLGQIKEIFKETNKLYVVYEELGINLLDLKTKKLNTEQVINICKQLLKIFLCLKKQGITIQGFRPQFFFLNKKIVKLSHLQPKYNQDKSKIELTETQDFKYASPQTVLTNTNPNDKSHVFSIGCICSEFFINKTLIYAKNKLDYIYILCNLFPKDGFSKIQETSITFLEDLSFEYLLKSTSCHPQFAKLLQDMLIIDSKKRIGIQQALNRLDDLSKKKLGNAIKYKSQEQYDKPLKQIEYYQPQKLTKKVKLIQNNQNANFKKSSIIDDDEEQQIQKTAKKKTQYKDIRAPKQIKQIRRELKSNIKNKINKNFAEKFSINLNFDTQMIENLAVLPSLPKLSKPLRYQKNIHDNVEPALVVRRSFTRIEDPVPKIKIRNSKTPQNKSSSSKKIFGVFTKRTKTLSSDTQGKLEMTPPKLTNYALCKSKRLDLEKMISNSFGANKDLQKDQIR